MPNDDYTSPASVTQMCAFIAVEIGACLCAWTIVFKVLTQ